MLRNFKKMSGLIKWEIWRMGSFVQWPLICIYVNRGLVRG
uniref:Uncharacterized protein n=1 Tax=Anguilla anguilla TaxID=7936 RepID=A0A0E9RBJ9_ANGAN